MGQQGGPRFIGLGAGLASETTQMGNHYMVISQVAIIFKSFRAVLAPVAPFVVIKCPIVEGCNVESCNAVLCKRVSTISAAAIHVRVGNTQQV